MIWVIILWAGVVLVVAAPWLGYWMEGNISNATQRKEGEG